MLETADRYQSALQDAGVLIRAEDALGRRRFWVNDKDAAVAVISRIDRELEGEG